MRTDHKPLLEIVAGTAKSKNSAAADKFCRWTSDILAGDPHPTIQYKKGSLSLIAESLSRLRTGEHYNYDILLHNAKPLILKKKVEISMVTTHAKSKSSDPGSSHPHTNSADTKVETDATIKSEQHTTGVA